MAKFGVILFNFQEYQTIRVQSQQKVAIAEQLQLMLEKYQERIAKELAEFKYELEMDTPGVTETIEKGFIKF